ncbi:MAG: aminoacyl-histidine dipeptidase [Eubacteriales bacterium]|nr:aminoacyl-histidine dipeptidase [Eubacteriales bacterium]
MIMLENLNPKELFSYFEAICAIPHGSGNTKEISDWIVDFANKRNLEYYQDDTNNVIVIKQATPGYEDASPVILQGHIDMVCEKDASCTKDMTKEGIDLVLDGDILSADGTTLGGDNGIAVSMMLAILDSNTLQHPRVEAVFTVDEEIGLLGAASVDVSPLKGKTMINIDSEDEGAFTVSCAGGNVTEVTIPVEYEEFTGDACIVKISGLIGGHSGIMIDKGRGNANSILGRVLYKIASGLDVRIISVKGGLKDNAIPVEAEAKVIVTDPDKLNSICEDIDAELKNELAVIDNGVTVTCEKIQYTIPMNEESTKRIITLLCCAPHGVISMSPDIEGLVQTSLNLGVVKTEKNCVIADFSVRSSIESQKKMLSEKIECLAKSLGGTTKVSGDYPGWQYAQVSPLRDLFIQVFTEQYGYEPKVEAIHAGLECGLFAGKIPGLDCVSIGPDQREIHTPRENVSVSSVERVWNMVIETLKRIK